jgi:hypothetical protein
MAVFVKVITAALVGCECRTGGGTECGGQATLLGSHRFRYTKEALTF